MNNEGVHNVTWGHSRFTAEFYNFKHQSQQSTDLIIKACFVIVWRLIWLILEMMKRQNKIQEFTFQDKLSFVTMLPCSSLRDYCGFHWNHWNYSEICRFKFKSADFWVDFINPKYISSMPVIKYGLSNERPTSHSYFSFCCYLCDSNQHLHWIWWIIIGCVHSLYDCVPRILIRYWSQ